MTRIPEAGTYFLRKMKRPIKGHPGRKMKEALDLEVRGVVVRGHGVASGKGGNPRFPGGSLAMQAPLFREEGFDLGRFVSGTLNVSLQPRQYRILRPSRTLRQVAWHPEDPPEDFSFLDAAIRIPGGRWIEAVVYHPHPETKPRHLQPPEVLEILATEWVEGAKEGAEVELALSRVQIEISGDPASSKVPGEGMGG